jgi:hypothetical protein
MGTTETVGVFLNGLRVVAIDGTCLDIPDSDEMPEFLVVQVAVQVQELHFPRLD